MSQIRCGQLGFCLAFLLIRRTRFGQESSSIPVFTMQVYDLRSGYQELVVMPLIFLGFALRIYDTRLPKPTWPPIVRDRDTFGFPTFSALHTSIFHVSLVVLAIIRSIYLVAKLHQDQVIYSASWMNLNYHWSGSVPMMAYSRQNLLAQSAFRWMSGLVECSWRTCRRSNALNLSSFIQITDHRF